jgi:hypothetical protein
MDAGRALQFILDNEEAPRLASLRLAEAYPPLRTLIRPSGGREWDVVFEEGYLGVYKAAVERGQARRLEAEDLLTLLRRGHFAFAEWAVSRLPVNGDIRSAFLVDLSRARAGRVNKAMLDWVKERYDLTSYISRESFYGDLNQETYRGALKDYINMRGFEPELARWMARTFYFAEFDDEELPREVARGRYNAGALKWLAEEGYIARPIR